MALVGVEDLGLRMAGQRAVGAHRPHPAHAEQQFLAQPVLAAAAVEPVGDLPQARLVLLHVGVEQQQRHPAHLRQPHLRRQRAALAQRQFHAHRRAVAAAQQGERQAVRVAGRVALQLPALRRQRLAEVAVPVQQPHPDQRDAQVAGCLEMVTGQDAEPAGVLRQRGGDPVLGGEVGDGRWRLAVGSAAALLFPPPRFAPAPAPLIPPRRGQVLPQVRGRAVQPVQVFPVGGQRGQVLGRNLAEQRDRVVARPLAARRVERGEQLPGAGMPGPAQIQHQVVQRGQRLGQRGPDGEGADGSHAERP